MLSSRYFVLLALFIFLVMRPALAQEGGEKCPFLESPQFNVFIPGYKDTIQDNGLKTRTIQSRLLTNGFELHTSDSLVRIKSFILVFDDKDASLYLQKSRGNKIIAQNKGEVSLEKITGAKLITIERITVDYRGRCFVVPAQAYVAR